MSVNERLAEYAEMTAEALEKYLPESECLQKKVIDAARYSLKAGGKRLRPALVMEFCRVCGGEPETALPAACAVEMMHTFSLIHDDLPCMDNDDMRRGKPSCHKAFGEAEALLAGDALAMLPFRIIAEAGLKKRLPQDVCLKLIRMLESGAGVFGMIGGQTLDLEYALEYESKSPTESELLQMYSMKTGALLEFSCAAGCVIAGADAAKELSAKSYGGKLGLAFQIVDDILDVTADEKLLGKPVGSDAEEGKHTFVTLLGLEGAKARAAELTRQAKECLADFPENDFLLELTDKLLIRNF